MTKRFTPWARKASSWRTSMGRARMGTRHFGISSVYGCSRRPMPAAMMRAFFGDIVRWLNTKAGRREGACSRSGPGARGDRDRPDEEQVEEERGHEDHRTGAELTGE